MPQNRIKNSLIIHFATSNLLEVVDARAEDGLIRLVVGILLIVSLFPDLTAMQCFHLLLSPLALQVLCVGVTAKARVCSSLCTHVRRDVMCFEWCIE